MPSRVTAGALAIAALLCGCGRTRGPTVSTPAPVCRVGPDGGPVADKGIGGTGAPVLADKGIGGTGIVAVISGFASICLAGQEVTLPPDAPIVLGDSPASVDQLRAGQVAVIDAGDAGAGLLARRVTIRFEVSGPVDSVTGSEARVAGQRVTVTEATRGVRPMRGDWVAVSGIRRDDGVIEATLMQPRPPGPVVVHGVLRREEGAFRIGTLVLARAPGMDLLLGQAVTATGPLLIGQLMTTSIAPDLLATDPAAYFGPAIGVVLIEGYASAREGRLRLGQGFAAPLQGAILAGSHRGIYRFERSATGLRAVGSGAEPAPTPGAARGGRTSPATGDRSGGGGFRPTDAGGPGSAGAGPGPHGGPGRGR